MHRLLFLAAALTVTGCAEAERLANRAIDDFGTSRETDYETSQGQTLRFDLAGRAFADRVVDYDPNGARLNDGDDNPSEALGPPTDGETYVSLGGGGTIVLEFTDNTLTDGPGDDLAIFEIGPQVEAAFVAVSEDGRTFVDIGRVGGSTATLDLAGRGRSGATYRFVRITDDPDQGDRSGGTAGADIDAVGAIHGGRR